MADNESNEPTGDSEQFFTVVKIILAFASGAIFLMLMLAMFYSGFVKGLDSGQLGTLGDFIGGLMNPLAAIISVAMLAYTLMQNQKALKISADELAETRKELKRQAEASEGLLVMERERDRLGSVLKDVEFYRLEIDKTIFTYKLYFLAGLTNTPTLVDEDDLANGSYRDLYLVHPDASRSRAEFFRYLSSLNVYINLMLDAIGKLPVESTTGLAEITGLDRRLTMLNDEVRSYFLSIKINGEIRQSTISGWAAETLNNEKGGPVSGLANECLGFISAASKVAEMKSKLKKRHKKESRLILKAREFSKKNTMNTLSKINIEP